MTGYSRPVRLCAAYKVFNGALYLGSSLRSIYDAVDRIVVFVSTRPWNGPLVPMDDTVDLLHAFPDPAGKLRVVIDDFRTVVHPSHAYENELIEMNRLLDFVRSEYPDTTHYLYVDADEVYPPGGVLALRHLMGGLPDAGQFHCRWRCYWKSFRYWIEPMEPTQPMVAFRLDPDTRFTGIRWTSQQARIAVSPAQVLVHHFSYALPGDAVRRKLEAWSHRDEVVDGWFERVWLGWDTARDMENLHPVAPPHYRRAVPSDPAALPPVMRTHPFFGREIV